MHINGLPVRYAGRVYMGRHPEYVKPFLSLEHARELLETLQRNEFTTDGDSIVLWPVKSWESEGEVYGHTEDLMTATHRVSFGPRGAVRIERY